MTTPTESPELTARDLLAVQFPDWSIWTSDAGRYWATRHLSPTEAQVDAGCARTVDADSPADLITVLAEQGRRSGE